MKKNIVFVIILCIFDKFVFKTNEKLIKKGLIGIYKTQIVNKTENTILNEKLTELREIWVKKKAEKVQGDIKVYIIINI